ncbi:cytochrome b/b6 domain-containing protein [Colwellia psychrerythraea]|uniref:Di-heme cytochrome, transmembrane n=1 Tax=Colwellia psychrerythraea TaxID=28229 RepID=A0A099KT25_COLPS|nr:cytochrome b/b6 domain-containing protein [Colwellia psychrerythraea]KGJ92823.1 Di-heme cytochrome, transmembrane [Colwellia psychrerythraea]
MTEKHLIWDLPLRIFHWSFAGTILASWYTAEQEGEMIDLHMQLGFVALGLIIFRILWGVIGPKHARFVNFIPSPKTLISYLHPAKESKVTAGHNPLGALMVVLMIVLITLQAVSGLFINDDIFSSGPYYGSLSNDLEKIMAFIHHNTFDFMIAAIALHLGAVAYYWHIKKQNLVLPMITGKKSAEQVKAIDAIPHSKVILGCLVAVCCVGLIYWLVVINAPVIEEFYY